MKYGILGDIHANLEALEAMLERMENEGVEKYVSVGDVVGYGANPHDCIEKVKSINATVVVGNHDLAAIEYLSLAFFNAYAQASAVWTKDNLGKEDKDFLKGLPLMQNVNGFTVVHSTVNSPELFEYIQTSYDAHLSFASQKAHLAFVGHSHIPVNFIKKQSVNYNMDAEIKIEPDAQYLINVGSVGQPRDDNPMAASAIYDSDASTVKLLRVNYDVEKASKKIAAAGLPELLAERILYGR